MDEAFGTILDGIQDLESRTPDRVYLTQPIGGGRVRDYTFREALDEARRMATHLRSLGHPDGSHIAILAKNSAHFLIADFSIWLAGHVSVPLYPTLTADTVRTILEHSESKLVFVGKLDAWDRMKGGVPNSLPRIALPLAPSGAGEPWDAIVARTEPLRGHVSRDPDEVSTLIYTSGTTGTPKGVIHSFRTMTVAARGYVDMFEGSAEDRALSYLPLAHVYERALVESTSMLAGSHLFFAESLETFVKDLKRAEPTLFISVPRLWAKFRQEVLAKIPEAKLERLLSIPIVSWLVRRRILKELGLHACRSAGSGSAPIPPEVLAWYRRLGLEMLEGYAMTENFAWSHCERKGDTTAGSVGPPCPGVEHKLSADGEVLVKSPSNMLGYYKAPELTAAAFTEDGYLRTGDLGRIDAAGRLFLTGRSKELFKTSKGKYVSPQPIENRLMADPVIEQACVTGEARPRPYALVVLAEDVRSGIASGRLDAGAVERTLRELRDHVNSELDPHESLDHLVVLRDPWSIENGMLTPTLKIRRSVIERAYGPRVDEWYDAPSPVIFA